MARPPANGLPLPGTGWQLAQSDRTVRYRPRSICVNSCGSEPPAKDEAVLNSKAARAMRLRERLRIDQSPRALEVFVSDCLGRPKGKRPDGKCGVVAGVLWKCAGPEDEQVRYIPALQIAIDDARVWVAAHHCATVEMSRLIGRDIVRTGAVLHVEFFRAHCLDDFRKLVGQKPVLLDLVLLEIHRDPH